MKYLPYAFSKRYSVVEIPTRGRHTVRAIVFQPPHRRQDQLSPLHLDFHGGAFLGGLAEYDAPFCELLSDRAGTVVISAQYRYTPAHIYPCAHEDAEDVVEWVLKNARPSFNADPDCFTVSGSSVGGNLMLVAGTRAKAAVGICAPVDFRIPPWKKPKPENFPKQDPSSFLMPLFDAYAGPVRDRTQDDFRLNPILKDVDELPQHILLIVAGIDILAHEELTFLERIRNERRARGQDERRRFDALVFDEGFHGWLELPSSLVDNKADQKKAYDAAIELIRDTHRSLQDAALETT
ncbi:hypothetical protein LTR37_017619 [Vermiconidia calcicola]|uniref:Uncharacterized protein n=1 Tax=Vermiconidia calcicola TaxID=1690605 RepID=A0ACC3MJJ7_9PEZI|nr:hypothetical protein LTR37_017619 [Vermiconidia calcicola]